VGPPLSGVAGVRPMLLVGSLRVADLVLATAYAR
jgi:hypothetical protein